MSRSAYSDDCDGWSLIRWRGAVQSAVRGKRGQQLIKDLIEALEKMEPKILIAHDFMRCGQVCALGAVGVARGLTNEIEELDPECPEEAAKLLDIAPALAREIEFVNDADGYWKETPAERWERVYKWAKKQLLDRPLVDVLS